MAGFCSLGFADDDGGHAGDGGVRRDIVEHHAAGADLGTGADFDAAEDFRAGADQHAGADDRMAVAGFLAGAAERDFMEDRDIVLDDRGFTDDEGGGVVEQDAAADARGGMDVHGEDLAGDALQVEREPAAVVVPELVGDAVSGEREEALEEQARAPAAKNRPDPARTWRAGRAWRCGRCAGAPRTPR